MLRYAIKRLLLLIPTLIGISFIIFMAMHMSNVDFVDGMVTDDMSQEQIDALKAKYDLDKPAIVQYGIYIYKLCQGDLGNSYATNQPVAKTFFSKIPNTLRLGLASCVIGYIIALPLGILAATHSGSLIDNVCNVIAVLGLATPNFWVGLMLIMLFSVKLGWLPSFGMEPWTAVIMPAITVGTAHTASLMRITRTSLLDCLHSDYLRTARSKGVKEKTVVLKHAFRNAGIPILHLMFGQLSGSIAGAALTETVFAWDGVGRVIVQAVQSRDVPLACGCMILKCTLLGILGMLNDMSMVLVDPRIKTMYVKKKKGE